MISDQAQISRADLSRATGLTRTTVSDLVAELLQEGLVEEIGHAPSGGGKPPTLLQILADSRCMIGVDLASHEFHGAVVNLRGKILHRFSVPVYNPDGEQALERVYELVDGLLAYCSIPPLGIGIGTPGLVNGNEGIVRRSVVLDWRDLPLGGLLHSRYKLPVHVANDCQAAALAEMIFSNTHKTPNLIVVKIGRGIGSGVVLNGHLHMGDGFGAGEIGHMVVKENGVRCRCGHFGCLETILSTPFIVKQVQEAQRRSPSPILARMINSVDEIDFKLIIQAYSAEDALVKQVLSTAGQFLGIALANYVSTINIERIMLAGSMAVFSDVLIQSARQTICERTLEALGVGTSIQVSNLGNDIVVLGAAALLMQHELGLA